MKENDLILNMLANPNFTMADFQTVGLNSDNTGLRSEEEYKKSEKITKNSNFQNAAGEFDEAKFHNFYVGASQWYNQLATQDYDQAILNQVQFTKDDIWAKSEQRTIDMAPKLVRQTNERLVTSSLESFGKKGRQTLSQSEIAQAQPYFDTASGEFKDSPNNSFFNTFLDTLVLATYDEDVKDENNEIIHKKGEVKLNEEGLPYYETLGGRDVYGKQVLSKFNMLTTDGSTLNKFDFFDTDDLEQKSAFGTLLRNAALVGSMFIPGNVGAVITGLSVATQTAGLLATLGKVFAGNDNDFLNNVQGWAKTVNRTGQTDYAAQNTWCVENFLNMIGDTIGQLAEQRWIFKNIPKLMGNNQAAKAMNGKYKDVVKEVEKEFAEKNIYKTAQDILKKAGNKGDLYELSQITQALAVRNNKLAIQYVDDLIQKTSEKAASLSKAYMIGLTVQDTYGEAKQAGASDLEAALLTVGYAAAEAKLLNSELGNYIFPELHLKNYRQTAIAKALTQDIKKAYGEAGDSKKSFVQKVLKIGSDIRNGEYSQKVLSGVDPLKVVGAHAAIEATEEVSEELLADVSKSIFNAVRWIRGEESLQLGEWNNMFDRYAMSALGGFLGGGINSAATNYTQVKSIASMDKSQALQELIYMVSNGKDGEFLKSLNNTVLGNKNLSSIIDGETGNYKEGTKDDNQDKEIKTLLTNQVKYIKDILTSENALVSKESLLNNLTMSDQKEVLGQINLAQLKNATSMTSYLEDFMKIQTDILKIKDELLSITNVPDAKRKETIENNTSKIATLKQELAKRISDKNAYLSGQIAPEAIFTAMFEMNPYLNHHLTKTNAKLYIEALYNKKYENLSDEEKKEGLKKYKEYSETSMKNDIVTGAKIFRNMLESFTDEAQNIQDYINNLKKDTKYQNLYDIVNMVTSQNPGEDSFEYLQTIQNLTTILPLQSQVNLGQNIFPEEVNKKISETLGRVTSGENISEDEYNDLTQTVLMNTIDNISKTAEEILKVGYIHPEVKNILNQIFNVTNNYLPMWEGYKMNQLSPGEDFPDIVGKLQELETYKEKINNLKNTPILEYLNKFQLSATNSKSNLTEHINKVLSFFEEAGKNNSISELYMGDLEEETEEALFLVDSFIATIEAMKTDNVSVFNSFGFTKLANQVFSKAPIKNYKPLAELDSETANLILQDAYLVKNRLKTFQNIDKINRGQKLSQDNKVATNKNYILFNKLQQSIKVMIPDDWTDSKGNNAKQQLESLLNSSEALKSLTRDNLNISKKEKNKVNKELLAIEDYIFDIFNNNDLSKLEDIIYNIAGMGGFFEKTGEIFNDSSEFIDNNAFIWWLASKAALKSSQFYNVYKKAIEEDIAPVASQEAAVQLGVAAIANSDMLNKFVNAYHDIVVTKFKELSEEDRKKLLENRGDTIFAKELLEYFSGHDVLPQYRNMVFIEGIPGSGKSNGVFKTIKRIIDVVDPSYFENAIYAHTTKQKAETVISEFKFSKAIGQDKSGLMKYMSDDWRDVLKNPKNKDNKIYLYDDSYEFIDGKLVNKWRINKVSDPPKVIFIDEISHYNQQELALIEDFAKENGIVILTAGDLDQDKLTSFVALKNGQEVQVGISRNFFPRVPKLGTTFRSLNKQLTHSILSLQNAIQEYNKTNEIPEISFNYLNNDSNHPGFYGVSSYQFGEDAKKSIDLIFKTATEPVGFMYSDENSQVYKYLTDNYEGKFTPFKGSDAQGLEGQYYIIEPNTQDTGTELRNIYTGVSRASQGAIVINASQKLSENNIKSTADPNYQLSELSKTAIKQAANRRKEELESLIPEGNELFKIQPPLKITKPEPKPKTGGLPPTPPPVKKPDPRITNFINTFNSLKDPILVNNINNEEKKITKIDDEKIIFSDGSEGYVKDYLDEWSFKEDNKIVPKYKQKDIIILKDGNIATIDAIEEDKYKITLKNGTQHTIDIAALEKMSEIYKNSEESSTNEEPPADDDSNEPSTDEDETIVDQDSTTDEDSNDSSTDEDSTTDEDSEETSTNQDSGEVELPDTNVEEYQEQITEENTTEIPLDFSNTKTSKLPIKIYTFNAFEMGVKLKNGELVQGVGSEGRVDNAIGLLKQLELPKDWTDSKKYEYLEDSVAHLGNFVMHNNNADILAELIDWLKLNKNGDYNLIYAIKSTAGEPDRDSKGNFKHPDYLPYAVGEDEEVQHIQSDNKTTPRKKLVLLLKSGKNTIFELTLGSLESPLTIMQTFDDEGNYLFNRIYSTFMKYYTGKDSIYSTINNVIKDVEPDANDLEQELINLFKFWQFTSNGIFYLGEYSNNGFSSDFSLSDQTNYGPLLIKHRGSSQIKTDENQFNADFIDIDKLAENPKLYISGILQVNQDYKNIKKGHNFILVSDNPKYRNDSQLVEGFEKGDPSVKRYYVIPPKANIKEWIDSEYNGEQNSINKTNQGVPIIGNMFTPFRIMQGLKNSKRNLTEIFGDEDIEFINKVIPELEAIESKWDQETIQFGDTIYGNSDEQLYNSYKNIYKDYDNSEKLVRDLLRIQEQKQYLESIVEYTGMKSTADKPVVKVLRDILVRAVYPNPVRGTTVNEDINKANKIQEWCRISELYYKTSKDNSKLIGSNNQFVYTKVYSNYELYPDKKFQTNAKIDTSTISLNNLSKYIQYWTNKPRNYKNWEDTKKTSYFYFNKTNWILTDIGKKSENDYLNKINVTNPIQSETPKDKVFKKYSTYTEYFKNVELEPTDTEEIILNKIIKYINNQNSGIFARNNNGQLTIFKFPEDISQTIESFENDTITAKDSEDNIHIYKLNYGSDNEITATETIQKKQTNIVSQLPEWKDIANVLENIKDSKLPLLQKNRFSNSKFFPQSEQELQEWLQNGNLVKIAIPSNVLSTYPVLAELMKYAKELKNNPVDNQIIEKCSTIKLIII